MPEGFSFDLDNRSTDLAYGIAAIWAADQWRQIGLNVKKNPELWRRAEYLPGGQLRRRRL